MGDGPRITIVGGGSHQWTPRLVTDIANTPSLRGAHLVLEDVDAARVARLGEYAEHVARVRSIPLSVETSTEQRAALRDADFVVVTITTGGFASMTHDLEVPARHGLLLPVVDGGPAGVSRSLRNIPVLVGIARDMADVCPHAWLLNLTNPLAQLCRAVTRATDVKTVGLCHEVSITRFFLSLLFELDYRDVDPIVTGVNHFPVITELDAGGRDGLVLLRAVVERGDGDWLRTNRVKAELFRRTGGLPGAGDRHLVEYAPGFLGDDLEERWGVVPTTIAMREADERAYVDDLAARLASTTVPTEPSGEMVAPVIDALVTGRPRTLPLDVPNTGQCPDLPLDAVVESMCVVDGDGIRGRDEATLPPALAELLRGVVTTHELTVEAGLTGDRDVVHAAMDADPIASELSPAARAAMTDELLAATAPWLPAPLLRSRCI